MEKLNRLYKLFATTAISCMVSLLVVSSGVNIAKPNFTNFRSNGSFIKYTSNTSIKPYQINLIKQSKGNGYVTIVKTSEILKDSGGTSKERKLEDKVEDTVKVKSQAKPIVLASRGTVVPIKVPTTSNGQKIVDLAMKYTGTKYVYGGSSPTYGFDCSGFTSYIYKKLGVSLPRDAAGQASVGTKILSSQLIAGDLVFFQTYSSGISHVGIYIGGGRFIHAATSRTGVIVSSMSESYYSSSYKCSRRVFK